MSYRTAQIAVMVALLLGGLTSFAQVGNQGLIQGTVIDQTGAVVPGAEITATRTATGTTVKTTSKEDGFFEFPGLPVGIYDLEVRKPGFAALADKGVELNIGAKLD